MKYAEDIIKEIEERGKIDLNKGIIDDDWEDYIRGVRYDKRRKRKSNRFIRQSNRSDGR